MDLIKTRSLSISQWNYIYQLWNSEYPKELNHESLDDFKSTVSKWLDINHYLFCEDGKIAGWLADFHRDKERWFSIIVSPSYQGKGVGKDLIKVAKQNNADLNGWVINDSGISKIDGSPYRSPLKFYTKIGFEVVDGPSWEKNGIRAIKVHWHEN